MSNWYTAIGILWWWNFQNLIRVQKFYQVLFISNKRSRTLNGIFLTLKLVKIPNRKLRLTSIIINISGKNYDPILLETIALNTLMTMKRWNTLKLFDTYQQSWNGFEHVAQPRKISYNKNCKIKAKQRRPLTIWT